MFTITRQLPADGPTIEALLDRAFGAERVARPSYRLRDAVAADPRLGLVARGADGALLATIRFWPIDVVRAGRARPALLLGPLAVEPALKGCGIGKALLRAGLDAAARDGHALILLVGDPAYYAPFGFVAAAPLGFAMAGEVGERLQALALAAGAFGVGGTLVARRSVRRLARRAA